MNTQHPITGLYLCTKRVHYVTELELVPGRKCCKNCHNEEQKIVRDKKRVIELANRKPFRYPKTRVCKDCKKRKSLNEFYKQKPPRIPKFKPDHRSDCKDCHAKKCKKAYLARTTKEERKAYIRIYFRNRNNVLPSQYRVAA